MSNEFHLELFEGAQSSGHPCTCDIGEDHPPTPSVEMKDLAARMAADEANEGNYTAAAELQAAADRANAEIQRLHGPVDDAPTGLLTPGQVPCRVCQLDDRTRAASSPDDLLCHVCRVNEPNRIRRERWSALRTAAAAFLGLEELEDDETAAGSMERDLVNERIGALMQLAELVDGHTLPYSLVNAAEQACEVPAEELERATDGRESDADAARRFAGQCLELQKRVEELEANERHRKFVEKSLDRLKPQLVRRIAEVICPPLDVSADEVKGWSQLQIDEWAAIQRAAREAAERLVEKGLRFVPSDAEIEAAQKQLRFMVCAIEKQDFQQIWDGALYDSPSDPEIQGELRMARDMAAYIESPWGVFGLVRVPDETVFGQEADRG